MISKSLLNKSVQGRELSDSDLLRLKAMILSILVDVDSSCKKHGLHYYLAWGTLLGAVRHKGFIPWDDDIDIFVSIFEMDSLRKALLADFGNKYFFGGIFPTDGEDPNCQMKIMLTGTKYVEIQNIQLPFPRGIGIDVFPIISMPKGRISKKIRKKRGLFLLHAISVEMEYRYPPFNLLSSPSKKIRKYYRLRRFLGFLLSFKKLDKWKRTYFTYCVKKYEHSDFIAFGAGIWYLFGGKPITSSFLTPALFSFENQSFISFSNYDSFLKTAYGNYMEIPARNDQEKHVIYDIDFGNLV